MAGRAGDVGRARSARGGRRRGAVCRRIGARCAAGPADARVEPEDRHRHRHSGAARAGDRAAPQKRRQGRADRPRPRHRDRGGAAAAFRDHDLASRCRDRWPPRARRLRRRLGDRCGAARFHDQRDLSRARRHAARSGRRSRRSRGAPGALCRRSRDPHRRGCAAAAALLPFRSAFRHRPRRSGGARRLPCRRPFAAGAVGRARLAGTGQAARNPRPGRGLADDAGGRRPRRRYCPRRGGSTGCGG